MLNKIFLLIVLVVLVSPAHAIVAWPILEAAEDIGYQVVGEWRFLPGHSDLMAAQVESAVERLGHTCPLPKAAEYSSIYRTRVLILAWSDKEYPRPDQLAHSRAQIALADERGRLIDRSLRRARPDLVGVDIVNMAHRRPQVIARSLGAQIQAAEINIKEALEVNGAAPSTAYGTGLFAEYSQRSKVILLADCHSPAHPSPINDGTLRIAALEKSVDF